MDDDNDWLDGFLTGWIMFDNPKTARGILISIIVILVVVGLVLYF